MSDLVGIDRTDRATWPELMTVAQVAHVLQCSDITVRRRIRSWLDDRAGRPRKYASAIPLPATKQGRQYRIYREDLLQ